MLHMASSIYVVKRDGLQDRKTGMKITLIGPVPAKDWEKDRRKATKSF